MLMVGVLGFLAGWQLHNLHFIHTLLSSCDPTGVNRKGIRWF